MIALAAATLAIAAGADRTPPTIVVQRPAPRRLVVDADDAGAGVHRVQVRLGRRPWRTRSLQEVLFDGTRASYERWRHAGAGEVTLSDGVLRTSGGLGLFWFAEREFGDATFTLQWREARSDGARSNGGVFVRFPAAQPTRECDTRLPLALTDFTWHAVACGHEVQINDGDVDPQQTGSVYAFEPLGKNSSPVAPFGAWNDYAVRTAGEGDYAVSVARNGELINTFDNTPGQRPSTGPPSSLYPGTEYKQFASGFFGLQNHGDADIIEYRAVRALPLGPRTVSFRVPRRPVRVRAIDAAGNRSRVVRVSRG